MRKAAKVKGVTAMTRANALPKIGSGVSAMEVVVAGRDTTTTVAEIGTVATMTEIDVAAMMTRIDVAAMMTGKGAPVAAAGADMAVETAEVAGMPETGATGLRVALAT